MGRTTRKLNKKIVVAITAFNTLCAINPTIPLMHINNVHAASENKDAFPEEYSYPYDEIMLSDGITIKSGERMDVLTDEFPNKGTVSVSVNSTTIENGGWQNVIGNDSVAAVANNTTINGGIQSVGSYGELAFANSTTINHDGRQIIYPGAMATQTTINDGGTQIVYGDTIKGEMVAAIASDTTINSGGIQKIKHGGLADKNNILAGGTQLIIGDDKYVAAASNTVINGGIQKVGSLGQLANADNTTINMSGEQHVYAGATATNTTINDGGVQTILGASVDGKMIEAKASDTVVNGGTQEIKAGGYANDTKISDGTQIIIGDEKNTATAENTIIEAGIQYVGSLGQLANANNTIVGMMGEQQVYAGATVTNTTINGGVQTILGASVNGKIIRAIASDTTVNSGGIQEINAGGYANDNKICDGTQIIIGDSENAAVADNTLLNGGIQYVGSWGQLASAINTTINDNSKQLVCAGASATHTIINNGGRQTVLGSNIDNTMVEAKSYDTIINNGGIQNVKEGGIADKVVINSGGIQNITSGGKAYNIRIANGGIQNIASGGYAENIRISSRGIQNVEDGGIAVNVSLESSVNGEENKNDFSTPDENNSTNLDISELHVYENGVVNNTEVNENTKLTIHRNGKSYLAHVTNGGIMDIKDGGFADRTIVSSGAIMQLERKQENLIGPMSLRTTIEKGGKISVDDGAVVQFEKALGGALRLLYSGGATAIFGDPELKDKTVFSLDVLDSRGDTVQLGTGDKTTYSTVGSTLNIDNMNGTADFIINTDLKNNSSDKININKYTNTYGGINTISVNYDPSANDGNNIYSTGDITAITVADGASNFNIISKESEIGGGIYKPEISFTNGQLKVHALQIMGYSNMMQNTLTSNMHAISVWRDSYWDISSRLDNIKLGANNGVWTNFSHINQDVHGNNGKYNTINVGFDRQINDNLTIGAAFSHNHGSENYEYGNGNSRYDILSLYGQWKNKDNHYIDMVTRIGKSVNDITAFTRSGQRFYVNDISRWGRGISVSYSRKIDLASDWYMVPKVGINYTELNGASFISNDSTRYNIKANDSLLVGFGSRVGRNLKNISYYLDSYVVHDFTSSSHVESICGNFMNMSEHSMNNTWLDLSLGLNYHEKNVNCYMEIGGRIGGTDVKRKVSAVAGIAITF